MRQSNRVQKEKKKRLQKEKWLPPAIYQDRDHRDNLIIEVVSMTFYVVRKQKKQDY